MVNGMSVIDIILIYGLMYFTIYIYIRGIVSKNCTVADSISLFIKDLTHC